MATEAVWHGNKKCAVNGAKLPKANRVLGQACPFCGNTIGAYIGEPESAQETIVPVVASTIAATSWWSRRKIWQKAALIVLGALVTVSVLGALFGDPEESALDSTTTIASETTAASTPVSPDDVATTLAVVTPETTVTTFAETTTTEVQTTTTSLAIPGRLGMSPDEFREGWNEVVDQAGTPALRLPPLTIEDGEVQDIAQVLVTDRISVLITVNKADGSIRDVGLFTQPSDDLLDNAETLVAWAALFRASTVPPSGAEHASEVFDELGILDGDLEELDAEAVVAGVDYSALFSPELGLFMLFAGDPLDTG